MRILQISSAQTFGGGEKHLLSLCKGLTERNHDVRIVLRPQNDWQKMLNFLENRSIYHLPLRNSVDVISVFRLVRLIRSEKIEIVHAHLARDYTVASLAVRFCPGVKLLLSRHVLFAMKNIHKIVLKNVDRVIAISVPTEVHLKKIFPDEKISLIPYGFEITSYSEAETKAMRKEFRFENNIPYDVPLIGIVGELSKLKGQKEFVLAAEQIRKIFPDVYFLSSGKDNSYSQTFRRELKRLVKILDLTENFVWLDWVENMNPLYAALDVLVSASHTESFGLAISEAMASETAVVSTKTEGACELITNGITGRLVGIDAPVEISDAVCALLGDRKYMELMAKNARAHAVEHFGLERMLDQTEELYSEVTKKR